MGILRHKIASDFATFASMVRSRIAPTPSGYLHIGNAINFVLTWLWVRKEQGVLRLRIDDRDAPSTRPDYMEDIFRTLEWLGLDWDEGPQTPDEQTKLFSQQLRTDGYSKIIDQLIQSGNVFACDCSRKEIQTAHQPCHCRHKGLPLDEPGTALRMLTPENTVIQVNDAYRGIIEVNIYDDARDIVIRRRDGVAAYHPSSLADDIDFNINLIIRGEDLLPSTAAQLFLSRFIDKNSFSQTIFYHHPLIKDEQGQKLSKTAGSMSLKTWHEKNHKPADFYKMMSKWLGWGNEVGSLQEMHKAVNEGAPLFLQ